jgi:hypothetical protein
MEHNKKNTRKQPHVEFTEHEEKKVKYLNTHRMQFNNWEPFIKTTQP